MSKKNDKDKFKFVNPNFEEKNEDFLIEDDNQTPTEAIYEAANDVTKAKKDYRILKISIILFTATVLLVAFAMFWQYKFTWMALGDALWFAFVIEFFAAWTMFAYNHNTFSSLIHGFKSFGLMLIGKRTKLSYYEYIQKVESNPIPSFYYKATFISSFIILIPAIILLIIYFNGA